MDLGALKRMGRYLLRHKREAALPYVFLVVAILSQLAVPRLIRNIIDAVTEGVIARTALDRLAQVPAEMAAQALPQFLPLLGLPADWTLAQVTEHLNAVSGDAPRALMTATAAIFIFAALRGVFAFLQAYWAERNSQGVAFDLRNDLFAKIQRLSFSYHDQNQTGQLMIRATDDVEKVRLFIGQGLLQLAGAFMLITGTLILLFTTNARLAFVALPILPIAFTLFVIFGTISQPLFAQVQVRLSALNTVLQENLAGIKVVKAFVREGQQQEKFEAAADSLKDQQVFLARLFSFLFPLVFLIANLGQAAILYYGGRQIVEGTLTLGQWQEFSLYLVYLFLPVAQFGFVITQMGQASASATRLFDILDAHNDVSDKPGAIRLPDVEGEVKFENVGFRYYNSGEPVLAGIDLHARPGETIALLGATGSGKTTIINLIPRFYDPTEGRITISGHDLRDVTLDSLRAQIGIVLQETTLFSGTIRENIAFGKPEATLDEVTTAAKAAAAHDFIESFPQGYSTPVGERGSTLSGGQKQRIAIARALLLNPRILILDDSTSSVDMATEAQIQRALDELMKGRTSFVIAQRISTVRNADQILVLEGGRVVAQGMHAELLESSPIYAEIYSSQLVEDAVMDAAASEAVRAPE
ncbi:MAG: ABC transporter ATP-binding protein [Chloroflexi bacterium]|nr:ABC transporter ATP-binding protein [Chloroflexota bacterium]